MPHWPVIVKLRVALATSAGGPYAPAKPLPRVSATRHGLTPMKGSGLVTSPSVVTPWEARDGDQVAGAAQFAIPCWASMVPDKTRQTRTKNETTWRCLIIPPTLAV